MTYFVTYYGVKPMRERGNPYKLRVKEEGMVAVQGFEPRTLRI